MTDPQDWTPEEEESAPIMEGVYPYSSDVYPEDYYTDEYYESQEGMYTAWEMLD